MEIKLHKFPTITDGIHKVEEFYCELINKYRSGEELDLETLDWLDQANVLLIMDSYANCPSTLYKYQEEDTYNEDGPEAG